MVPPHPSTLVLLFGGVLAGAFLGTAIMHRLAWRYGWLALPRENRWHKKSTALHGGIGFYPAFLIGAVWILFQTWHHETGWGLSRTASREEGILAVAMLLGSFAMLLFGLWDDVKTFRPATKLLGQLIATSLFVHAGGFFRLTNLYLLDLFVTYFWFVGVINSINLLDNMDGLASGVSILASLTLIILTLQVPGLASYWVLTLPLGLVFMAALLGFWLHNRPPARIFMGDSGSLSMGYILAALSMPTPLNGFMQSHSDTSIPGAVLTLLILMAVLAIPIFDTTLVTVTRAWRAQNVFLGGRDHVSHRLVRLGLSERNAVWLLYALAASGGTIAILMQRFPEQSLPVFGFFGLILVLTGVYLGYGKVHG